MKWISSVVATLVALSTASPALLASARGIVVDRSAYDPACGVSVEIADQKVTLRWPLGDGEIGQLVVDLGERKPLFESLAIAVRQGEPFRPVLTRVDPVLFLVVGQRQGTTGRPPGMSEFNEFFDSPASRPFRAHRLSLDLKRARVFSHGRRATLALGELSAGSFAGDWHLTVYPGARLVHVKAVVTTSEKRRAILYDAGFLSDSPPEAQMVWIDTDGKPQMAKVDPSLDDRSLAVRHRVLAAESSNGALACFPPPHQYFFPRDLTENQQTVWYGRNHRGLDTRFGFGIRQTERGGGGFVPWFNAPPGTEQHLGVFLLLARGDGKEALRETLRYTNHDRFPSLPGYHTLTSHFHMAIATAALELKARHVTRTTPDFVQMFKDMGVEMVHLAEFHGDGHPADPGSLRLPEIQAMFDECRRLSGSEFLLIPGEEANVYLGLPAPGRHPGHWLYLFPRPVTWTMKRKEGQPFREEDPSLGPVYHVGSRSDMLKLLEVEHGLAWTAHPRIKASSWTPDIFRHEDFFLSEHWLGAAWKAMPADLSDDRLGRRVLDLMDDMANWGQRKYVLGEVDVFKLDHTHELYGHMNINYLKLDRVPSYDQGWKSVLDSLRAGRFFVSTGEVLIPEFEVDPRRSGSATGQARSLDAAIHIRLRWTFPLRFAELVSGDGVKVYRQRIDLSDTGPFGEKTLDFHTRLQGRTWARLEAWDIACNGAFTQPLWLSPAGDAQQAR
jgi:hypothetical protein